MVAQFCLAAACTLLGNSGQETAACEWVDAVEINHCFNAEGKHVFDQLIFYDCSPDGGRPQIRDWRLIKRCRPIPQRDHSLGSYRLVWVDGDILREVRARTFCETWTTFDPELAAREQHPQHQRKELYRPRSAASLSRRGEFNGHVR